MFPPLFCTFVSKLDFPYPCLVLQYVNTHAYSSSHTTDLSYYSWLALECMLREQDFYSCASILGKQLFICPAVVHEYFMQFYFMHIAKPK